MPSSFSRLETNQHLYVLLSPLVQFYLQYTMEISVEKEYFINKVIFFYFPMIPLLLTSDFTKSNCDVFPAIELIRNTILQKLQ